MTKPTILLDLDGTLVDTERLTLPSMLESIEHHYGIKMTTEEYINNFLGIAGSDIPRRIGAHYGVEMDDRIITQRPRKPIDILREHGAAPVPHMTEILLEYANNGCTLAIVSNSDERQIGAAVGHLNHPNRFDFMEAIGGRYFSCYSRPKPDPFGYENAMMAVGALPEESVAVEDSPAGAAAAVEAGIATVVGYVGVAHHPDRQREQLLQAGVKAVMDDWREFKDIVPLS